MHSLMISEGRSVFVLLFKTPERAEQAWALIGNATTNDHISLEDDYGTRVMIHPLDVVANMEDMEQTRLGAIERHVANAKLQVAVQTRLNADPHLRVAASMAGPPVHSQFPQGNGRLFS